MNWPKLITTTGLIVFLFQGINAQPKVNYPNINEARKGHLKPIKIPKIKDYHNFTKNYGRQLKILNRRSEKYYRKNFLKFIEIEDELLYTLCDSNEFRANALMRSASASFGKMEKNRNTKISIPKNEDKIKLENAISLSAEYIPGLDIQQTETDKIEHKKNQDAFNSKFYSEYMNKRLSLYKTTFKEGTEQQKKLLFKLKKRALLWQAYQNEDELLLKRFVDQNTAVFKSLESRSELVSALKPRMVDYTGTQLDPDIQIESFNQDKILSSLKEKLMADGLFNNNDLSAINNTKELFTKLQELRNDVNDSTAIDKQKSKEDKPVKINSKSSLRFWDRLYGGVDFDWQKSTRYFPEGIGIAFKGGYHISDNSGLNLEIETVLDASKIKRTEDKRFETRLLSRYSMGANIDYKVWKLIYLGLGGELATNHFHFTPTEITTIEIPEYTVGIPLIFKILLPIATSNSTSIELRYDLNSKNNVKPKFDFKIGFLIGR